MLSWPGRPVAASGISAFVPLARLFRREGWRITLLLQNLDQARKWFDPAEVTLLLAPLHTGHTPRYLKSINTSSLLSEVGWLDDCILQAELRGWLSLFDVLKPQLLLCEYAPVAMLAARFRPEICTVTIGCSSSVPVLDNPMPPLRWWLPEFAEVAARHDAHILKAVNMAVQREKLPQLTTMQELWQTDERILCTLPPLDFGIHYGQQRTCWGGLENAEGGGDPVWPAAGREKIFAYLRPGMAHFETILQALQRLGLCSLVVSPGIPDELKKRYSSSCLMFSPLVNIGAVLEQATLVVSNGTHGMVAQALRYGIPSFISPVYLEHRLHAMGAYQAGACTLIDREPTVESAARQLDQALMEPGIRQAAVACSQMPEARRTVAEVAEAVTSHCITLAAKLNR